MFYDVCYTHGLRDIASAIKDVLDAVNEVSKKHQGDPRMREYKKVTNLHLQQATKLKSSGAFGKAKFPYHLFMCSISALPSSTL